MVVTATDHPRSDPAKEALARGPRVAAHIAGDILRGLPPDAVFDVILAALPYRPDLPRALDRAAATAVRALLGIATRNPAVVERLAAVARGVHVRSTSQDVAPQLRELADLVRHLIEYHPVPDLPMPTRGARLAAYLEVHAVVPCAGALAEELDRVLAPEAVAAARERSTTDDPLPSLVTDAALVLGVLTGSRREAHDRVRRALARR